METRRTPPWSARCRSPTLPTLPRTIEVVALVDNGGLGRAQRIDGHLTGGAGDTFGELHRSGLDGHDAALSTP